MTLPKLSPKARALVEALLTAEFHCAQDGDAEERESLAKARRGLETYIRRLERAAAELVEAERELVALTPERLAALKAAERPMVRACDMVNGAPLYGLLSGSTIRGVPGEPIGRGVRNASYWLKGQRVGRAVRKPKL